MKFFVKGKNALSATILMPFYVEINVRKGLYFPQIYCV